MSVKVQTRIPHLARDMNRPSAFIKLGAEDFLARFTELFAEHIDGFVGLSRRPDKAKKMEWRRRLEEKHSEAQANRGRGGRGGNDGDDDDNNAAARPAAKKRKIASGQIVSNQERAQAIARYRAMVDAKKKKKQPGSGGKAAF